MKKPKTVFLKQYDNNYSVSENADIYSYKNNGVKKLKWTRTNGGDYKVTLSHRGVQETFKVQILVAMVFIPNPQKKRVVLFKDGNKSNVNKNNLMWATYSELKHYMRDRGLLSSKTVTITKEVALKIKKALRINKSGKNKLKIVQIANKFGVSATIVSTIKHKRAWANIDEL